MIVDLLDQVTGYLDEGQVVLTCEVYGVIRSSDPMTWLSRDGSPIDESNTPKYILDQMSITSPLSVLFFNGSSVPGQRSNLTINQLGIADQGTYTCMVDGNSATVQLTVVASPAPSTCELSDHYW